jgi:hypothetical protein
MKKIFALIVAAAASLCVYALDAKYAPIVNTALAGLKTHSSLALLQGHTAISVVSGNKELDIQFGEEIQKAYPNFTSVAGAVRREDLYQMTVKVYRENDGAAARTTVTDFRQQKIVDSTVTVKNVSAAVRETLQYKTAIAAKNEFEAHLDSVFGNAGEVVQDARLIPKPPKEPFVMPDWFNLGWFNPDWFKPDISFAPSLIVGGGLGAILGGGISGTFYLWNFYFAGQYGLRENEFAAGGEIGYLLKYNEYLYISLGFDSYDLQGTDDTNEFGFSAGILSAWKWLFVAVKFNLGTNTKNYLSNTAEICAGVILRDWQ